MKEICKLILKHTISIIRFFALRNSTSIIQESLKILNWIRMNEQTTVENKEEILIQGYIVKSEICNCFSAKMLLDALSIVTSFY